MTLANLATTNRPIHPILWRMRRLVFRVSRWLRHALKLFAISPREWRNLVVAQIALVHARYLLWVRETGRLVSPQSHPGENDRIRLPEARSLALAVRRAALFGIFRPTCLVQSMALVRILERDGLYGGRIRIGVRERAGEVQAHAWVEYGGEVIGDFGEHVATFTELTDVQLVGSNQS